MYKRSKCMYSLIPYSPRNNTNNYHEIKKDLTINNQQSTITMSHVDNNNNNNKHHPSKGFLHDCTKDVAFGQEIDFVVGLTAMTKCLSRGE